MKKIKILSIFFIILAAITGGLGLGFLIDALVVGSTDPNGITYGIVSAVTFVICIASFVTILCFSIMGKNNDKKQANKKLIILPSKKNISFDPRDVDLFTIINTQENEEEDFPCLIEADLHSCASCKAMSEASADKKFKESQRKNKVKHAQNIRKFERLISGISKDTNLIILKQKEIGKVFVPSEFIDWPIEDEIIVDVIENDNVNELLNNEIIEQIVEKNNLKILDSKNDIANVDTIVETFTIDEIPMEQDVVESFDNENVYIQGPVVEDIFVEQEINNEGNDEYVDCENVYIQGPVVEDIFVEQEINNEGNDEYVDCEVVHIQGPVVEDVVIIEETPATTINSIYFVDEDTSVASHNCQFVEWPADQSCDLDEEAREVSNSLVEEEKNDEFIDELTPVVESFEEIVDEDNLTLEEPTPIVEQKVEQVKECIKPIIDVQPEKEFVVQAEDLYDDVEIVGDDSRIFEDHEELEAVAMTLKETIANSLFTGKQNVVFVKRPPVRLFTKIYIIDRASECVIGEATVKIYERGLKKQIWSKYSKNSTIKKDQYDTYYSSSLLACALVIKTVTKYKEKISITKFGITKVPSTFVYIPQE